MELKKINDVSPRHPYVVFRNSVLHSLVPFFCILVPLGLLCYYLVKHKDFPGWFDGGLQGLVSAVAFLSIRPGFRNVIPDEVTGKIEKEYVLNDSFKKEICIIKEQHVSVKGKNILRINFGTIVPAIEKAIQFFTDRGIIIQLKHDELIDNRTK